MNLGFVGVGPWAQKLATAFRECGAEIAWYDRASERLDEKPPDGFGERMPWRHMLTWDATDALIICAPPDVTTEVALACAKAGKRCVGTKPLMWTEGPRLPGRLVEGNACTNCGNPSSMDYLDASERLASDLYVDLWRLYSPAWLAMKKELRGKKIERIDVAFCGNGPFRSFNGALDYGPHALAFVFDLCGSTGLALERVEFDMADRVEARGSVLYQLGMTVGDIPIKVTIGNGAHTPLRFVDVQTNAGMYRFEEPEWADNENPNVLEGPGCRLMQHPKSLALRRFCRAFMAGEASRTLELSIASQRVLERIVE